MNAILLASSRKGTHLLTTALEQRAGVVIYDQPLTYADFYPEMDGLSLAAELFDQPCTRILSLAWEHARDRYEGFWDELKRRPLQVIHFHRRNMLRWYVSCELAKVTDQWIAREPPKHIRTKITINPAECVKTILRDWRQERQANRFLADHLMLHLWYEDLARNFEADILRVQMFLGLAPQALRPRCHKQQTRPLTDVIGNYAELSAAWNGTPWEWFLRDNSYQGVQPCTQFFTTAPVSATA